MEEESVDSYSLISIHCSEEPYKLAYMLNRNVLLRLKRKATDLDFSNKGLVVTFPIFEYIDPIKRSTFHLVANKCYSPAARVQSSGGLFDEVQSERLITTYLMPEFKSTDYFLKIRDDFKNVSIRNLLAKIGEVEQIISAYSVDPGKIKSKNNLIFD